MTIITVFGRSADVFANSGYETGPSFEEWLVFSQVVLETGPVEMSVYDFAGVVGFLAYLGAYTALQLGFWRGDGFAYSVWNIIAASLVLVSLLDNFNLAAALINASWVMIGLAGLYIRHRSRRFLNN